MTNLAEEPAAAAFLPFGWRLGQSGPVSTLSREPYGWSRLVWCAGLALACSPSAQSLQTVDHSLSRHALPSEPQPASTSWAAMSSSPLRGEPSPELLPGCAADQALLAAAQAVAEGEAAGQPGWEMADVVARLRAAGSPYVWPRLWTVRAPSLDAPAVAAGLSAWLAEVPATGQRRCGVGRARHGDGSATLSVLAADVLADLDPLPTRVRLGQWLRLRARLLVPVSNAETVLLGPRGAPRTIPSELRPGEVRAVFSLDQPGMWRIQLLLATDSGPRPALEAWAFVDREPDASEGMAEAPGESLADTAPADPSELLLAMLNAARRSEQRSLLRRDERLDRLARAHAAAMLQRRLTAHDAGDGLPSERLRRAGINASLVGENVAHASNLRRAHRALWDSPAHRGTMLDARFEVVGLGVVAEDDVAAEPGIVADHEMQQAAPAAETKPASLPGRAVWVCELFANYR